MANPTNNEILKEIRLIHKNMDSFDSRLRPLEQWKIAYDAADSAIAKYKRDQNIEPPVSKGMAALNKDFLKLIVQLVSILGTALTIVYLVLSKRG